MNEYEIQMLIDRARVARPSIARYVKFLEDWVACVNGNSDGWPYWTAARHAGCKLADLIKTAIDGGTVTPAQWARAIGGIKSTAKRQLKHGNTIPVPTLAEGT